MICRNVGLSLINLLSRFHVALIVRVDHVMLLLIACCCDSGGDLVLGSCTDAMGMRGEPHARFHDDHNNL